jgi:hypothetical protein
MVSNDLDAVVAFLGEYPVGGLAAATAEKQAAAQRFRGGRKTTCCR